MWCLITSSAHIAVRRLSERRAVIVPQALLAFPRLRGSNAAAAGAVLTAEDVRGRAVLERPNHTDLVVIGQIAKPAARVLAELVHRRGLGQ